MAGKRIAVIGAGPIGLEAACAARKRGFEVVVLERGAVASNVRAWGHVRLFSPFSMNSSPFGRELLADRELPDPDAILTGREYVERYLKPLSIHPMLAGCIQENSNVVAVGRGNVWKNHAIGHASRRNSGFRLLIRSRAGQTERIETADVVLDCSGTYGNHRWLGAGGIPAVGETAAQSKIEYTLPDITGADLDRFASQRILVVGSGYSAATAIAALGSLTAEYGDTSAVWVTRSSNTVPVRAIANDTLTERSSLTRSANMLAEQHRSIEWCPGMLITEITSSENGRLKVILASNKELASESCHEITVDRILALTGYRPDRSLYEELQIHECYATQGPIKLAATLLRETSADCLTQSGSGSDSLINPEPDFFIIGAKSYGRDSRFLIKVGLEQVAAVLDMVGDQ